MSGERPYKHLFFDLDHTLWDFDRNSRETIGDLFHEFKLADLGFADFDEFFDTYHKVNEQYWRFYRQGKVSKAQLRVGRFRDTLITKKFDDQSLSEQLADFYVSHGPLKTNLFPGALEALEYLSERYELHLITNGFKEVQHIKVERSGLKPFFDEFIISEEIGFQKPHPEIFRFANRRTESKPMESMIIGDNLEADIAGGRNAGWGQVFFNPHRKEHLETIAHEIHALDQLKQFL